MEKLVEKKYFEVILHVLFWVVYFTYPIIQYGDQVNFVFYWKHGLLNTILLATSVYITYFLLHNSLWEKGKFMFLVLLFIAFFSCYLNAKNCNCNVVICYVNKFVKYLTVNIFFIALFYIKSNVIKQQKITEIEKESVKAELKNLKAQMNPHFLFNTLNMLYASAIEKDEVLASKILILSDSLHYLIHEGNKDLVALSEELAFINGYIDLQEARIGGKINTEVTISIDDSTQLIPSFLLIPFVENAYKYSSMTEGKNIPLRIHISLLNKKFQLLIENEFDDKDVKNQSHIWKNSGIGISNVRKRLLLLFPKNHTLTIQTKEELFIVHLTIDLA